MIRQYLIPESDYPHGASVEGACLSSLRTDELHKVTQTTYRWLSRCFGRWRRRHVLNLKRSHQRKEILGMEDMGTSRATRRSKENVTHSYAHSEAIFLFVPRRNHQRSWLEVFVSEMWGLRECEVLDFLETNRMFASCCEESATEGTERRPSAMYSAKAGISRAAILKSAVCSSKARKHGTCVASTYSSSTEPTAADDMARKRRKKKNGERGQQEEERIKVNTTRAARFWSAWDARTG